MATKYKTKQVLLEYNCEQFMVHARKLKLPADIVESRIIDIHESLEEDYAEQFLDTEAIIDRQLAKAERQWLAEQEEYQRFSGSSN